MLTFLFSVDITSSPYSLSKSSEFKTKLIFSSGMKLIKEFLFTSAITGETASNMSKRLYTLNSCPKLL